MKRRCLISRLDEPNIAHLYVIESDQNLINNIRVLCTRHPETLRFFVPEELFLEIRNGEPVAMTVECYDEYGRKRFTVDPLKVLSEQIREEEFFPDEGEELDFRLRIEGYELPQPAGELADFLTRPEMYRRTLKESTSRGGSSRSGSARSGSASYGGSAGRKGTKTSGSRSGKKAAPAEDPTFRKRKKSPVKAILLTLVLIAAAAGVWFMRDTSVKRFEERMSSARYSEAVIIYNEEILGHEVREDRADPQVSDAVQSIRDGYLSEQYSYEDACAYLDILTGIQKYDLSEMAQNALEEVKLYAAASSTLRDGAAYMEKGNYIEAIRSFLQIEESSQVYGEAQENLKNCVGLLIQSAEASETEAEWLEAIDLIDSALELLPENEELAECREASLSKYQALVRSNAITEADEMAAEGDYEGAFTRIDRALAILPEDEQLTEKAQSLRKSYVAYITVNAVDRVNSGDFEGAYEIVDEALELYPCDEFDALYAQIEDGEYGVDTEVKEYNAGKVAFTEFAGEFKEKVIKQEHSVKTTAGGACTFILSKMDSSLKVQLSIKSPEGTEIVKASGLADGSEVNCSLEKDKTYTVQVDVIEGQGSYVLRFGQQKAAADITEYDVVRDSTEFKDQCNTYYFVPANSGGFRFDMTAADKEAALKVSICDPLGGEIFGGDMTDGGGVTVELTAGGKYRIDATQSGKTGEYELAIGKQEPTTDITGKCIVPGAITYAGQKKAYTFTAAESGQYRFTIGNMDEGCSVKLYVYSQLGEKLAGTNSLGSGEAVAVELKEGQGYQVQMTQQSGTGEYTLTIVKE